MISWLLCATVAATALPEHVGPLLDPIGGQHITGDARDVLPTARTVSEMADMWFANLVNMQNGGSGIALFDPVYLSSEGRAWSQQHFLLNDLDITDPAHPGSALIDWPNRDWDVLTYRSLYTDQPGFTWTVTPPSPDDDVTSVRAWASAGADVGGGLWLPSGVFDREPAYAYGAPTARRALHTRREAGVQARLATDDVALRVGAEVILHTHRYPTLLDASGCMQADPAQRASVWALLQRQAGTLPVELLVAWQARDRVYEGSALRWPQPLTHTAADQAAVAQFATHVDLSDGGSLQLRVGGGVRVETQAPHSPLPMVVDAVDSWLYLARPQRAQTLQRARLDAVIDWHLAQVLTGGTVQLRSNVQALRAVPVFNDASLREGGRISGAPWSQTAYAQGGAGQTLLTAHRLSGQWQHAFADWHVDATAALDEAAMLFTRATAVNFVSPAVGFAARWTLPAGTLFALVRREPEALTAQAARFVDTAEPSGIISRWQDDNGDGLPQADEQGATLGRTGGAYHAVAAGLRRPVANQFAIGYQSPQFGPFLAVVSGVGRQLTDRFTVQRAGPTPLTRSDFHDPGGDGRGEIAVAGGGQNLPVVRADANTLTQPTFLLTNDLQSTYYLGVELNLVSTRQSHWFLNIGGAAYLSPGNAPFGNGPDRNDPGVVSESSAGLNDSLNAWGRYDHDRSFALKLLAGGMPCANLTLSLAGRYRDGQPFTRLVVDAATPQGPTVLMATERGSARYTFHMNWDVHVRYDIATAPLSGAVVLDIFNVFGSAVELLEDPRTGPSFRRSVEVVPGRAGMLTLELMYD